MNFIVHLIVIIELYIHVNPNIFRQPIIRYTSVYRCPQLIDNTSCKWDIHRYGIDIERQYNINIRINQQADHVFLVRWNESGKFNCKRNFLCFLVNNGVWLTMLIVHFENILWIWFSTLETRVGLLVTRINQPVKYSFLLIRVKYFF